MLSYTEDRYGGITIATNDFSLSESDLKGEIEKLIDSLKEKKLFWIKVSIVQSDFIPVLTRLGFEFHHCDEQHLMLVKKLLDDAFIPATKNYILGVGAIVIQDNQLLVIKDRFTPGYKLPGGHVDKGETIKAAVAREVLEETGVTIVLESIMNIGHFHAGQFGEANIYLICMAKALSTDVLINDADEIIDARWMDIDEFLSLDEVNNYNKSVVKAALSNTGLKLTEQEVKLRISGEVYF